MGQTSYLASVLPLIVASVQPRFVVDVVECEECVKVKVMRECGELQCRVAFNRFTDPETGGNGFVISGPDYTTLDKGRDNLASLLDAFERQGIRA